MSAILTEVVRANDGYVASFDKERLGGYRKDVYTDATGAYAQLAWKYGRTTVRLTGEYTDANRFFSFTGASGGLGSYAIQLINTAGGNAIGVISDEDKRDFVMGLGAKGVINRNDFDCWGQLPDVDDQAGYAEYMKKCRKFGAAIWEHTGKGNDVDFVFEHPGEQTFPVSCFVVKRGGMVVFCAGTTGYNLTMDARFVWMRQKRIQGSHFANLLQASQANQLVIERRVDPCMSEVFDWADIPKAHTKMWKNQHKPGNMAVLVNAPQPGLKNFDDVVEAAKA